MSDQHRWKPRRAPGPFVAPVRLDPSGRDGPTRNQAAGPRWRTTSRGFHVPADVDPEPPEQRIVEAVPLLPPGGGATGWANLRLAHVGFLDGRRGRELVPVALLVGPHAGRQPRDGVDFLEDRLDAVVVRHGVPCVPVRRALFDEMRRSDLRAAVVALDMTLAAEVSSLRRMREYVAGMGGWAGVPLVRQALALGSELSRSPQETRTRLIWVLDADLPVPLVNPPVFALDGGLLGYPDLLDVEAGLVVEYDGDDHRPAERHSSDVDRESRFRRHRLEVTHVTGPDLGDTEKVVRRLLAARALARFEAPSRRLWTLTPPPWWRLERPIDEVLERREQRFGPDYCCSAGFPAR